MEHPYIEFAIFFLLFIAAAAATTTTTSLNDNTNIVASGATIHAVKILGTATRLRGAASHKLRRAAHKMAGRGPKRTGGATPKLGFGTRKKGLAAPPPPPKMWGTATPISLLPQEQEFLNAHNEVRYRNKLPPLAWDHKCAAYAKWYAKSRSKDCALKHSTGPFGENIFWGEGKTWTPKLAVEDWLDEHKYYNRKFHTCQSGKMCQHYTQIVWRDTQKVGCGHVLCETGDTYIVCSYDPPGNFQGKLPFVKHNPTMYNKKDRLLKLSWLPKLIKNNY